MKNLIFSLAFASALISCSKTEMQQTNDTIKRADSLFTKANDGFRTLDSISTIVNDSAKFNKVVVPGIEKTKESVERVIKDNAKSLDSLNSVLKRAKKDIERSAEVIKTVDSAGKVLKETSNPIDILSTISKTIDKVTKSNKDPEKRQDAVTPTQKQPEEVTVPKPYEQSNAIVTNPVVKSAEMEITVDDLSTSRDDLAMELRRFGGDIVSENFGEQNGFRKQVVRAKVPNQYFDEATKRIPERLGMLKSKNMESSGTDYDPNQMSDLEITLSENRTVAGTESVATDPAQKNETGEDSYSGAFMKGFKVMGQVFMALLPFWPVFLVIGLVWYFISRRNLKKNAEAARMPQAENLPQEEFIDTNPVRKENDTPNDSGNANEDPYARYKPK
ncbi:MAG: DUF4349 domain-containing protein [Weeksellaceae bacterium]|nr:DUF4349 domain-containing protein [Weeksellaceae bacterium]